jgi:dTDP-4-dehydrorhamnose 3,5-epimerase
MSRFAVDDLPLEGVKLVTRFPAGDQRGFLTRMFCTAELSAAGWKTSIAQINHSYTAKKGTVRGVHFQHPPHAEAKLVSCIRGEVWDVAVDIRAGSRTFLQWHAERLSADNGKAMLIPKGFAHGFQSLTDGAELLYFHSSAYAPDAESGLHPRDPRLAIAWPLVITELSSRDAGLDMVTASFSGIEL